MSKWRDVTPYPKHQPKGEPTAWELKFGGLRAILTHHNAFPGMWVVACPPLIDRRPVAPISHDFAETKRLAIAELQAAIAVCTKDLDKAKKA